MSLILIKCIYLLHCVHFSSLKLLSLPNYWKSTFSQLLLLDETFKKIFFPDCFIMINLSWHFMKRFIFRSEIQNLLWSLFLRCYFPHIILTLFLRYTWLVVIFPLDRIEGKSNISVNSWVAIRILIWIQGKVHLWKMMIWSILIIFQVESQARFFNFFDVDRNMKRSFFWFVIFVFYFVFCCWNQLY